MTKEPKLEAAVRIVPEWQDYDQENKQQGPTIEHRELYSISYYKT